MSICWVPNQNFTDCVQVHTYPDPVGDYCDGDSHVNKMRCLKQCVQSPNRLKTCRMPICQNSSNIGGGAINEPGNEECNDYCFRSDNNGKTWKYQYRGTRKPYDPWGPYAPEWNPVGPYPYTPINTDTCSRNKDCVPEYGSNESVSGEIVQNRCGAKKNAVVPTRGSIIRITTYPVIKMLMAVSVWNNFENAGRNRPFQVCFPDIHTVRIVAEKQNDLKTYGFL